MKTLASVTVGLILESLGISRGMLFLVDRDAAGDGQAVYRLRGARADDIGTPSEGMIAEQSPVALTLTQQQAPLLQYDIDLLPAYRIVPDSEREWLAGLETEVYVPIFSKSEWIGLFAFGSKLSGRRYTDEDLGVLATLASQTAVALENARLVENLLRLNAQLRQAYAALDQANGALQKIDRAKTDFISIASHELRTPLTVMRGYAGMLLDAPGVQQQETLRKWVSGIDESTLRMNEIMESMFDIAQIDNQTLQMHMQAVNLGDLIHAVAQNLRKTAGDRGQSLTVDLHPLPAVQADPNLLEKVFVQLIRNAIKFTPDGGKIQVSGHEIIEPAPDLPGGGVEIEVSDTGVGVAPEDAEIIFTKFFQPGDLSRHSSGSTKFRGAGAGLGLALSRGIVEAHGGRIWAESPGYDEENCPGSQFHVLLPLAAPAQGGANPPPAGET
jgi:signal transduction histidine kinase